jgi:hypothetical protein
MCAPSVEGQQKTPDQLLALILSSSEEEQLKICRLAISAGETASECFMAAHTVEIDNLRAHVRELAVALLSLVSGEPIDIHIVQIAANSIGEDWRADDACADRLQVPKAT